MFIEDSNGKLVGYSNFKFEESDGKQDENIDNGKDNLGCEPRKCRGKQDENIDYGKDIKIFTRIKIIGKHSFKDVDTIESVTIGKNVSVVEESAFENCKKLKAVKFENDNERVANLTIQSNAFGNCQELSEVVINSDNVTNTNIVIEKDAFVNCENLRTFYIEVINLSNVEIRSGAFNGVNRERFCIVVRGNNYGGIEQFARENGYRFISVN